MQRPKNRSFGRLSVLFLILLSMIIVGCGSSANMEAQISGKWKPVQGHDIMAINLDQNPKTLTLDGHTFKAEVESIDKGSSTMHLKVATADGKSEVWSIRQMWDDNGSTFKLAFRHDGTTETLVPINQS